MKINSVFIRNFRSIKSTTLRFYPFTILAGENNAGKTNILQALDIVFNSNTGFQDTDINSNAKKPTIYIKIKIDQVPRTIQQTLGINTSTIILETRFSRVKGTTYSIKNTNGITKETIRKIFSNYFYYVPSIRDINNNLNYPEQSTYSKILDRLVAGLSGYRRSHLNSILKVSNRRINGFLSRDLRELSDTLNDFLPNTKIKFDTTPSLYEVLDLIKLIVKDPSNSECIINRKGHGFHSLVIIALYLHLMDINEKGGVIAIEEPELHLHPQLQRVLFRLMRKSPDKVRGRIICSTHSTYFLDQCNLSNVVHVRHDENGTVVVQPRKSFIDNQIPGIIKNVTEALSELLYARLVVLVEGPSEKNSLHIWASRLNVTRNGRNYVYTLANHGVSVYVVGSKTNYLPFIKILDEYKTPWVVVTDNDSLTDKSIINQLLSAGRIKLRDKRSMETQINHGNITSVCNRLKRNNVYCLNGDYEDLVLTNVELMAVKTIINGYDREAYRKHVATFATRADRIRSDFKNAFSSRLDKYKNQLGISQTYQEENAFREAVQNCENTLFSAAQGRNDIRIVPPSELEMIKAYIKKDKVTWSMRLAHDLQPSTGMIDLIKYIIQKVPK